MSQEGSQMDWSEIWAKMKELLCALEGILNSIVNDLPSGMAKIILTALAAILNAVCGFSPKANVVQSH
jgi:hypothetical protein